MLPVCEPALGRREEELVRQCIASGWISSDGPFVKKFEDSFSDYLGARYGVAVCNGTVALETALFALGVQAGDEVIVPAFTIISCAIAVIRLGAVPVLVDVCPDTWCIDSESLEAAITSRTKAIMAVHMYGHPADMDAITSVAKKHNVYVLEDAAQVHGGEYKGKKCGAIADIAAFSFYANKIITTGEGGMVVTSNDEFAERARYYRNLCFRPERRFYHTDLGNNYRMTSLQAAVGVAQLERIEEFVAKKRELGEYYRELLSSVPGVQTQTELPWAKMVYWMYCVVIDEAVGLNAATVMSKLGESGIGCRAFFHGLHQQPALQPYVRLDKTLSYQVTERIAKQGLYLPSSVSLTNEQVETVVSTLKSVILGR